MQAARILTVTGTILTALGVLSAVFGLKCTTLLSSWRKRAFVRILQNNLGLKIIERIKICLSSIWPQHYSAQALYAFLRPLQLLLLKFLPIFINFYHLVKREDFLKWAVFMTTEFVFISAGSVPEAFYSGLKVNPKNYGVTKLNLSHAKLSKLRS